MIRNLLLILLMVYFAGGCKSPPPMPPLRSLEEVTVGEIQNLIQSSDPAKALQWIVNLRSSTAVVKIEKEELDKLEQEAKQKLKDNFYQAIEASNYAAALPLYLSYNTLYGPEGLPGYTIDRLQFLLAEAQRRAGNLVVSLVFFRSIQDRGFLTEEDLLSYAKMALELKNYAACRGILKELEQRNYSVPRELAEEAAKNPPLSEYLTGTVTIWVNRGFKIDRGVGVPDRVIGSGFYIDPRGYLLTNYHVIQSEVDPEYEGYSRLFIRPSGRIDERIPAKVVGYDRIFDIALLKVEVKPPFIFGISDVQELRVGSRIFALGSPGGLENTLTSGIVSAVGRRFFQLGDAMQMDVPVNPGSSGGPLIDEEGKLIGIVFAGIEQFQGVNFAIPAYWIQKILPSLYNPGEVIHSWMGVSVLEERDGLEVLYVTPGSPAFEVGLKRGDRLLRIGGVAVKRIRDAQSLMLSLPVQALVRVTVLRDGGEKEFLLTLQKRPYMPLEKVIDFEQKENLFPPLFGMTVRRVSSGLFSDDFIVEKVYRGSIADETGISENDPFTLRNWLVDKKKRVVLMQISIKQRKAGFLEGGVQVGAFLEQNNFL